MTTVATTLDPAQQGIGYQYAYSYLAALVCAETSLHIERAITATAVLEARKRRLTDSITSFDDRDQRRADEAVKAERWLTSLGTAA
jgi:hypothetical protein